MLSGNIYIHIAIESSNFSLIDYNYYYYYYYCLANSQKFFSAVKVVFSTPVVSKQKKKTSHWELYCVSDVKLLRDNRDRNLSSSTARLVILPVATSLVFNPRIKHVPAAKKICYFTTFTFSTNFS